MVAGIDFGSFFSPLHDKDVEGAKFKIGDEVKIKSDSHIPRMRGIITGVNCMDEDLYEYSLEGFVYLYYENELEKINV